MKIKEYFKDNSNPFIIAEIGQNHDGSLGQAHAFIDMAADCGVDAVKFQTHIANEESTKWEQFRVKFSYEDKTRYDYWKRMEFSNNQWKELFEHAQHRGLEFLSSPFSIKALSLLDEIGIPAWKLGSGEVFNKELFNEALKTGKPMLLSTGLSTWEEIDSFYTRVKESGNEIVLFQCVTAYPSYPEIINISLIEKFRNKYKCIVGISDHSSTIYPCIAAAMLGAKMFEVHVTMSPYMFGPDVKASVTPEDLRRIVEGVHFVSKMRNCQTDISCRDEEKTRLYEMFSKSLYYERDIPAGQAITESDIMLKKPYSFEGETEKEHVIGRVLVNQVKKDDRVKLSDFMK